MSPADEAWLTNPKNCRGKIGSAKLYSVTVRTETWERAQMLTALDELPADIVWMTALLSTGRAEVHTNNPVWFVNLEEQIDAARRAPR